MHAWSLGCLAGKLGIVQVLKGVQEDPGQLLVIKSSEQVEALQHMGLPLSLGPVPSGAPQPPVTVPFTHMVPQMVQYTHRQAPVPVPWQACGLPGKLLLG